MDTLFSLNSQLEELNKQKERNKKENFPIIIISGVVAILSLLLSAVFIPCIIITVLGILVATIVGIIFNILFSDGVWYGYLPIIGSFIYSLGVILAFVLPVGPIKAEIILKIFLMVNALAWGLYGIIVKLYPIFVFNSLNILLCTIAIIRALIILKKELNNTIR